MTERLAAPPARPTGTGATPSLADILDRVLHRGIALEGNVTIGVANVDLLYLDLRLLLAAVDAIWPEGRDPSRSPPVSDAPPAALPPSVTTASPASAEMPRDTIASLDPASAAPGRDGRGKPAPSPATSLVRLVLTLVRLLHDVLERQAVRRMSAGHLSEPQIENLGLALFAQAQEIERLRRQFGLADRDLDLDLAIADRLNTGDASCPASIR